MSGSKDLDYLLSEANPVLDPDSYVFLTLPGSYGDHSEWQPIATFAEEEGLTLVVRQSVADAHHQNYQGVFKRITLQVHSSLDAVGLTARFSERLATAGISANVFAGYYHDHIFVAASDGDRAVSVLSKLTEVQ